MIDKKSDDRKTIKLPKDLGESVALAAKEHGLDVSAFLGLLMKSSTGQKVISARLSEISERGEVTRAELMEIHAEQRAWQKEMEKALTKNLELLNQLHSRSGEEPSNSTAKVRPVKAEMWPIWLDQTKFAIATTLVAIGFFLGFSSH